MRLGISLTEYVFRYSNVAVSDVDWMSNFLRDPP